MPTSNTDLPHDQRNKINEYIEYRLSKLFKTIGVSSIASLLFGIVYLFIYVPNFAITDIENKVTLRILSAGSQLDNMRSDLLKSIGNIEQSVIDTGKDLELAKEQLRKLLSDLESTEQELKARLENSIGESSKRVELMISGAEERVEGTIQKSQSRIGKASDELNKTIANNNEKIADLGAEIGNIESQLGAQKRLLLSISDAEITGLAQLAKDMNGYKDVQSVLDRLAAIEKKAETFATKIELDEISKEVSIQADYFIMYRKSLAIDEISELGGSSICVAAEVDAVAFLNKMWSTYAVELTRIQDTMQYGWIPLYRANTCDVYLDYSYNLDKVGSVAKSDRHVVRSIKF